MSQPSVWLFGDTPIGAVYGASYMLESWARELSALGWETRTVTPSGSFTDRARTPGALRFRTLPGIGRPGDEHAVFSTVAELLRTRRDRPDVVVVATPLRVGTLGLAIARYLGVPLVVAVSTDTTGMAQHYSSIRMFTASWAKLGLLAVGSPAIRRAVASSVRRPAASMTERSQNVAAEVVGAMGAGAAEVILLGERSLGYADGSAGGARVSVIPSGIDRLPEPTAPSPLGWNDGALRVLYAGRFSREKTLPILVDAVAEARGRGLPVDLRMIGGGHMQAGLRAQVARLGLEDHVSLHDGVCRDQLRGAYASADVFAFPSVVDTQAFVLNEAAHEQLPLVVADDINPVVEHDVSALVVEHDARGFADAFALLMDPALRDRLGHGARRHAASFTEAAQARKVSGVLERACGRAPEPVFEALREVSPIDGGARGVSEPRVTRFAAPVLLVDGREG